MNWYRVVLRAGSREHIRELQAHSIADAIAVTMVKEKLHESEETVRVADADCVDPPGWAVNAVRAAAKAVRP